MICNKSEKIGKMNCIEKHDFHVFLNLPNFQNFFRVPCLPSQSFSAKAEKNQKFTISDVPCNNCFFLTIGN